MLKIIKNSVSCERLNKTLWEVYRLNEVYLMLFRLRQVQILHSCIKAQAAKSAKHSCSLLVSGVQHERSLTQPIIDKNKHGTKLVSVFKKRSNRTVSSMGVVVAANNRERRHNAHRTEQEMKTTCCSRKTRDTTSLAIYFVYTYIDTKRSISK